VRVPVSIASRTPWADLRLRSKGLILVLGPVLPLLVAALALGLLERENDRAHRWVAHTFEVQAQIRLLQTNLLETEQAYRIITETGRPERWEAYRRAVSTVRAAFDQLRSLVSDNPRQTDRLRRVETLIEQRLAKTENIQEGSTSQKTPVPAIPKMPAEMDSDTDPLRLEFGEMEEEENRLLGTRSAWKEQLQEWAYGAVLGGALLGLLGAVFGLTTFTTAIAHRVERLKDSTRLLADGKRVDLISLGKDEIGSLEAEFQRVSGLLQDREAELALANAQLEHRVEQRTVELAQAKVHLTAELAERVRAEEAFRKSEHRFDLFMAHLPAAAFLKDAEGRYIYVNEAWKRQFKEVPEWLGKTSAELWPAETAAIFAASDEAVKKNLQPVQVIETETQSPTPRTLLVHKFVVSVDPDGRPVLGGISLDITERTRLEEQLNQSQKMDAIGRLAGGVAHDFNNLLTVILGYSDLLAEYEAPEIRETTEQIRGSAERAAELTRQLLAFSRQQTGEYRSIDLNTIVPGVVKMLGRVVPANVPIRFVSQAEISCIRADVGQIEQILVNLVINARDAMPAGGTILIETLQVELDKEYCEQHQGVKPGSYVMLAVSDTGQGMSAETQSHIFEPFFTTKEKGRGTGLGLSIVYGIVKQHEGHIWVYSEPGHGSTFKLYFPEVAGGVQTAAETRPAVVKSPVGAETVLVLDDNAVVRKLICRVLQRLGYTVIEAEEGPHALQLAAKHHKSIDLVITDVVMPSMSGPEFVKQLTAAQRNARILYMSGYTDAHVHSQGVNSDIHYLQKPFTPESLARKIRHILDRPSSNQASA
jgi:two-component system, cell cycle sensor histidine kinase and response regulator CckA